MRGSNHGKRSESGILTQNLRRSQVDQVEEAFLIQNRIFRLEVPVHNVVLVEVFKGENEAGRVESDLPSVAGANVAKEVEKVNSVNVLEEEIEVIVVLESPVHFHYEGAFHHRHDLLFN